MHLYAISDLHLSATENRDALRRLPPHPGDWLIVAGDMAERFDHIRFGFEVLKERFDTVIWVPGNHELWSIRRQDDPAPLKGVARYEALVTLARSLGVLTPEDAFPLWPGPHPMPLLIAPLFLLYDYSFRPAHIGQEDVVRWAREQRTACGDQFYLKPDPYPSRQDWCAERVVLSAARLEERLSALPKDTKTILINHYPLREELIRLPRAPRLSPWCGTRQTHDWHTRFRAHVAISGHLHTRRTDRIGDTRFEEVSLGYPAQWTSSKGLKAYLRRIL